MAKITYFMYGAGNTEICLRRNALKEVSEGTCDVLSDLNVFGLLPSLNQANIDPSDIFVIATRVQLQFLIIYQKIKFKMDSFNQINGHFGADISALSSIISLLSIAHAIGKHLEKYENETITSKRQILFAFFHGVFYFILN